MKLLTVVCLLVPAIALADPKTADEWYKEGATQYNLGDFDKAVEAFKKGFELETNDSKKPAYLYNIAQAYRQAHRCSDAEFFYKRYLSLKDQDTAKPLEADKRAEIEGWIAEEEKCAQTETTIAQHRPDSTIKPDGTGSGQTQPTTTKPVTTTTQPTTTKPTTTVATKTGDDSGNGNGDDDDARASGGVTKSTTAGAQPQLFVARLTGGVGKVEAGNLTVPIQGTFDLFAGYPIAINDQLEVDVGVNLGYMPVPFTNLMTNANATASLISALADAGATYMVTPAIGVRGDLGVGALIFSGMGDPGNPFTNNGAPTTGALGMLAVRAALSGDYAITPNLIATLVPIAFEYSPAKSGLRDDIKSIMSLDFMLGLGYRM
jgi:tetratricopeptide (TPR) repeat protein